MVRTRAFLITTGVVSKVVGVAVDVDDAEDDDAEEADEADEDESNDNGDDTDAESFVDVIDKSSGLSGNIVITVPYIGVDGWIKMK